jgi:hypothetical protein
VPAAQPPLETEFVDATDATGAAALAMAADALAGEDAHAIHESIGDVDEAGRLAAWALSRGFKVEIHAGESVTVPDRVIQAGAVEREAPTREDVRAALEARHPLVVHTGEGWVVLLGGDGDGLDVLDPREGQRRVGFDELAMNREDAVALELGGPNRADR